MFTSDQYRNFLEIDHKDKHPLSDHDISTWLESCFIYCYKMHYAALIDKMINAIDELKPAVLFIEKNKEHYSIEYARSIVISRLISIHFSTFSGALSRQGMNLYRRFKAKKIKKNSRIQKQYSEKLNHFDWLINFCKSYYKGLANNKTLFSVSCLHFIRKICETHADSKPSFGSHLFKVLEFSKQSFEGGRKKPNEHTLFTGRIDNEILFNPEMLEEFVKKELGLKEAKLLAQGCNTNEESLVKFY